VQTVYDVFTVAPLGAVVVDDTAGSATMTVYLTGRELKNVLEYCLAGFPGRPGQLFPRASGMRFRYDPSPPMFDAVTGIEVSDLQSGYRSIEITGADKRLYSFACPLFLGKILTAIPKSTKGKLELMPKNAEGQPFNSRAEALSTPESTLDFFHHRAL
jgi:5'-nucleotidase / UDP-sugar diphosphatase